MIEMFLGIQREILDRIQEQGPDNHQYAADLHLIRQTIVGKETQEEKRLKRRFELISVGLYRLVLSLFFVEMVKSDKK